MAYQVNHLGIHMLNLEKKKIPKTFKILHCELPQGTYVEMFADVLADVFLYKKGCGLISRMRKQLHD